MIDCRQYAGNEQLEIESDAIFNALQNGSLNKNGIGIGNLILMTAERFKEMVKAPSSMYEYVNDPKTWVINKIKSQPYF